MEPRATRPSMPGYGVVPADEGGGLLPWSWAVERLTASHDYWVATVRPDGRPHVMPVWGVWLEDRLWFSSSGGSRKTRNLEANASISVATDDARQPVVVEGRAVRVGHDAPALVIFNDAVNAKYGVDYDVGFYAANAVLSVFPDVVIGLDDGNFTGSPTRWSFTDGTIERLD